MYRSAEHPGMKTRMFIIVQGDQPNQWLPATSEQVEAVEKFLEANYTPHEGGGVTTEPVHFISRSRKDVVYDGKSFTYSDGIERMVQICDVPKHNGIRGG